MADIARKRGFTLIETLLVIALAAGIASAGIIGIDAYRRGLSSQDAELVLAALRHARAQALDGVCASANCTNGTSHGIVVSQQNVTLYEGSSYASRATSMDVVLPLSGTATISGLSEITFERTGTSQTTGQLTLTDTTGRTRTITITTEGGMLVQP